MQWRVLPYPGNYKALQVYSLGQPMRESLALQPADNQWHCQLTTHIGSSKSKTELSVCSGLPADSENTYPPKRVNSGFDEISVSSKDRTMAKRVALISATASREPLRP